MDDILNKFIRELSNENMSTFEGERFQGEINKERRENLPEEIHVQFWFGTHSSVQDIEKLTPFFEECDIFIPESHDWDEASLQQLNDISDGKLNLEAKEAYWREMTEIFENNCVQDPGELDFPEFQYALEKMIDNSKKPIFCIDSQSEESNIADDFMNGLNESTHLFILGKFVESLTMLESCLKNFALENQKREKNMLENFKKLFFSKEKLSQLTTHPQLQGKKKWNILIQLGALHTGVFHELKKIKNLQSLEGSRKNDDVPVSLSVERHMDYPKPMYTIQDSYLRREMLKKKEIGQTVDSIQSTLKLEDKKVSWYERLKNFVSKNEVTLKNFDELVSKVSLDLCLAAVVKFLPEVSVRFSGQEQELMSWYIAESISFDDVKNISKQSGRRFSRLEKKDQVPKNGVKIFSEALKKILQIKGIPFFDTIEGAEQLFEQAKKQVKRFPGKVHF